MLAREHHLIGLIILLFYFFILGGDILFIVNNFFLFLLDKSLDLTNTIFLLDLLLGLDSVALQTSYRLFKGTFLFLINKITALALSYILLNIIFEFLLLNINQIYVVLDHFRLFEILIL